MQGNIEIYDWLDQVSGLTVTLASYDKVLAHKLTLLQQAAGLNLALRLQLDGFNRKVLDQMKLLAVPREGEAPLYYWVRAMKKKNALSFEDGEYYIPNILAACIVRAPGARDFVQLLGQVDQ